MADDAKVQTEVQAPAAGIPAVQPAGANAPAPAATPVAAPAVTPAAVAVAKAPAAPVASKPEAAKPEVAKVAAVQPEAAKVVPAKVAAKVAKPRAKAPTKAGKPRVAARKPALAPIPAAPLAPQAAAKPVRRATARRPIVDGAQSKPRTSPKLGTGKPKFAQFKDTFMANPFDLSAIQTTFSDLQGKAKAAIEKNTAALGDASEFAKGNVEAVVASGKILSAGLQDLGATLVAETRGAFEGLTADAKELAAAKSPTEFFQLQSAFVRKQFDGLVAQASKNTEAFLKLANETVAPLSSRVTIAVEKVSKAA
ncbi:phasin family protein [Novosphingobium bradum]|uniref:Phasin family protein n=1 Tax=Novosphingobium bradum TaxID=1737444 RepID=A0ABV7IS71_9SPHN